MVVNIQVKVFWIVMPCSVAIGYQCFGSDRTLLIENKICELCIFPLHHVNY